MMIMRPQQQKLLFLLCFVQIIVRWTFLFGRGLDNGDCTQYYNDIEGNKPVVERQREHLKNLIKK